jgi:arylsulfatase A-like enzyme
VDDRLVQLVDLLPTLTASVCPYRPASTGCRSASPPGRVRPGLADANVPERDSSRREVHALTVAESKYIEPSNGPGQLYDLAADPGELHDLAESHPERAADMRARLGALRRELNGRR